MWNFEWDSPERAAWIACHLWLLITAGCYSQILMNFQGSLFNTIQILVKCFQSFFQVLNHSCSFLINIFFYFYAIFLTKRSRWCWDWFWLNFDFGSWSVISWIFNPSWILWFIVVIWFVVIFLKYGNFILLCSNKVCSGWIKVIWLPE